MTAQPQSNVEPLISSYFLAARFLHVPGDMDSPGRRDRVVTVMHGVSGCSVLLKSAADCGPQLNSVLRSPPHKGNFY